MALRAVKPTDPVSPQTIEEAADGGSSRDLLATMRRALAKKLDNDEISSNAIASAYKELRELDRLIRLADEERAAEEAKANDRQRSSRRSFNATAL